MRKLRAPTPTIWLQRIGLFALLFNFSNYITPRYCSAAEIAVDPPPSPVPGLFLPACATVGSRLAVVGGYGGDNVYNPHLYWVDMARAWNLTETRILPWSVSKLHIIEPEISLGSESHQFHVISARELVRPQGDSSDSLFYIIIEANDFSSQYLGVLDLKANSISSVQKIPYSFHGQSLSVGPIVARDQCVLQQKPNAVTSLMQYTIACSIYSIPLPNSGGRRRKEYFLLSYTPSRPASDDQQWQVILEPAELTTNNYFIYEGVYYIFPIAPSDLGIDLDHTMYRLNFDTKQWSVNITRGPSPILGKIANTLLVGHTLYALEDTREGDSLSEMMSDSLYTLDLKTLTWTKVKISGFHTSSLGVISYYNGHIIQSFGSRTSDTMVPENLTQIIDVKGSRRINYFGQPVGHSPSQLDDPLTESPAPDEPTSSPPPSLTGSDSSSAPNSILRSTAFLAILGSVGGVLLIASIVMILRIRGYTWRKSFTPPDAMVDPVWIDTMPTCPAPGDVIPFTLDELSLSEAFSYEATSPALELVLKLD